MNYISIDFYSKGGTVGRSYVRSKVQAIKVLRQHGLSRNAARTAVNTRCETEIGYKNDVRISVAGGLLTVSKWVPDNNSSTNFRKDPG